MRMLTAADARRLAVAAQGLDRPLPAGTPTRTHLRAALGRIQMLQLDSVNVAVRAHYAPLFARLGPYPFALVDDAAWPQRPGQRLLVEYWAHAASLIPVEDWPLLRPRMRAYARALRDDPNSALNAAPRVVDEVRTAVADLGPVGAGELEKALDRREARTRGGWWDRSQVKRACEALFAAGELTTARRRGFERLYDCPERVLPARVHDAAEVAESDATRALVDRSARALGVATEVDLRDYYRLGAEPTRRAVAELVEEGSLEPVGVDGWAERAYLHVAAPRQRRATGRGLLCPFDPLLWDRRRTERLFGFSYRIEIYVPRAKRRYGYYVFPFLLDGELVARLDLKADRAAGVLRVPGAFAEPGIDRDRVAGELAGELATMAGWLGLGGVAIGARGDLAPALRQWHPQS